jgi:hypothetical protein
MQKAAPLLKMECADAERLMQNSIEGGSMLTGHTAVAAIACRSPSWAAVITTTDWARPRMAHFSWFSRGSDMRRSSFDRPFSQAIFADAAMRLRL